jgi:hypothetical protein
MRLDREALLGFLKHVEARLEQPAHLYLVGESALVLARAREWTDQPFVYTATANDLARLRGPVEHAADELGLATLAESPSDVVPTPANPNSRARLAEHWASERLTISTYDPYGAAIRLVARGDEPDYHTVIGFMRQGWMTMEELDRIVETLIAGFTKETLAQDPEEFRRKLKGLRQMWRADEGRRGKGSRVWQDTPRGDTLSET